MKLHSNVRVSKSNEGQKILFNSLNSVSIKYSEKDFKTLDEFLQIKEIQELLTEENFFESSKNRDLEKAIQLRRDETMNLILLVHENCNFRCSYCYELFQKNAMQKEVIEGTIRYVERALAKGKIKTLIIGWFGGEPLLNMRGIEELSQNFMTLCEKYDVTYHSSITTNGYLLTQKIYERLVELKVQDFQITIDGKKEMHDQFRVLQNGKGSYERIIDNLKSISQYSTKESMITLRMNVGKDNYNHVEEHLEDLGNTFSKDDRFYFSFHNIGNWGVKENNVLDKNVSLDFLEMLADKGIQGYPILGELSIDNTCYAAKPNNFVIGSDGMVYKCTVALYEDFNKFGKLSKDGIMVLDNEKVQDWHFTQQEKKCISCVRWYNCLNQKCPLGKYQDGHNHCNNTFFDINRILWLLDKQDLITYDISRN